MTKLRPVGSFEDAAFEIVRTLTAPQAGAIAGLSPKTIRDYSDPDRPGRPTLAAAVRLDAACVKRTGRAPFLEAYTAQLSMLTSDAPRDGGDVLTAALDIPGAVGRLLDAVRQSSLAESPKGANLSPNERAKILQAAKEPRREIAELEAAVLMGTDQSQQGPRAIEVVMLRNKSA